MSSRRAKRVGELIKEEISYLIQRDLSGPGLGFVTITSVDITNDLRYARVFVSAYGENKDKSRSLENLKRKKGFIRSQLSKKIRLRYFPELDFLWDSSIEQGAKMAELLEKINNERKNS